MHGQRIKKRRNNDVHTKPDINISFMNDIYNTDYCLLYNLPFRSLISICTLNTDCKQKQTYINDNIHTLHAVINVVQS